MTGGPRKQQPSSGGVWGSLGAAAHPMAQNATRTGGKQFPALAPAQRAPPKSERNFAHKAPWSPDGP
eukprot:1779359-Alexandrium_andersonii.AAC.1